MHMNLCVFIYMVCVCVCANMDPKAQAQPTRVDGQGVLPAGQSTQVAVVADVAPAGP
jgi:hypothetical protein